MWEIRIYEHGYAWAYEFRVAGKMVGMGSTMSMQDAFARVSQMCQSFQAVTCSRP